ncbi:MAG: hypothetical protein MHM6MM_003094 [Cercozoa sp. M6MM]
MKILAAAALLGVFGTDATLAPRGGYGTYAFQYGRPYSGYSGYSGFGCRPYSGYSGCSGFGGYGFGGYGFGGYGFGGYNACVPYGQCCAPTYAYGGYNAGRYGGALVPAGYGHGGYGNCGAVCRSDYGYGQIAPLSMREMASTEKQRKIRQQAESSKNVQTAMKVEQSRPDAFMFFADYVADMEYDRLLSQPERPRKGRKQQKKRKHRGKGKK